MRTLSAGDVRRIVHGGERFLLLDLVSNTTPASAVHIPFNDKFVDNVLARGEQMSLPIIIQGDPGDVRSIEQAVTALQTAGFLEVWSYFDTWPDPEEALPTSTVRRSVFSDPDAIRCLGNSSGVTGRQIVTETADHSCE